MLELLSDVGFFTVRLSFVSGIEEGPQLSHD